MMSFRRDSLERVVPERQTAVCVTTSRPFTALACMSTFTTVRSLPTNAVEPVPRLRIRPGGSRPINNWITACGDETVLLTLGKSAIRRAVHVEQSGSLAGRSGRLKTYTRRLGRLDGAEVE